MDMGKRKESTMDIRERMAEEEQVRERVDKHGNKWVKVYFGGGQHFRNWLEQCRELGEVQVEEIDSRGFRCYEEGGEKLYRIWLKIQPEKQDQLLTS
nr:hypothetical protein [Desulfobacterales bacterium]